MGGSLSSYLSLVRAKLTLGNSKIKRGPTPPLLPPPREDPNLGVTCGNDLSASRLRVKKFAVFLSVRRRSGDFENLFCSE